MPANGRLIGIVVLAAIAAGAGTLFGVLAVPEEHSHDETADHAVAHSASQAGDHDALHAGEGIGALLVAVVGIGIVPVGRRSHRPSARAAHRPRRDAYELGRLAVALASAGAATIHFAVIAQHFDEYWLFGSFFLVAAILQLAWASLVVLVARPAPAIYLAGAAGNAAIAAMWVVSRTTGFPLGPEPGEAEAVGIADTVATLYEVLIALGALLLVRLAAPRPPLARFTALTALATVIAAALTTLALLSLVGL